MSTNNDKGATNVERATPVAINTPAALLPCPLCGSSVHVKSSDGLSSILCESPSTCIGSGLGFMFIDEQRDTAIEAWNRRASTATVASESRGSVPDALRVLDKMDSWSDELDDEGMGIAYGAALHNYRVRSASLRAMLAAAPTPPAVSNGEEGAFTARVVEWKGIRFGVPAQIAKSFMAALEGTNGEPPDWAIVEAVFQHFESDRETEDQGCDCDFCKIIRNARYLARCAAAKGEG